MFGKKQKDWSGRLRGLFGNEKAEEFPMEELEALLFESDLRADLVGKFIKASKRSLKNGRDAVLEELKREMVGMLSRKEQREENFQTPQVILLLGVNGAGKTTFAGRLAKRIQSQGHKVIFAAADTFRAGAIDQIKVWGERLGVEVVAQAPNADPAAVVFDAWRKAQAENAILIADTAGRLHTKKPLVEDLQKIIRVLQKETPGAPHEAFLVLDATNGQNAIHQSKEFQKAVPLTGLVLTKLDGTARGGGAVTASVEFDLPFRYLGVGETAEDLLLFSAEEFSHQFFRSGE